MSDTPATPAASTVPQTTTADRIAKVIARSGVASRRDAEKMILEGRVAVNGVKAESPALDVLPTDKVTLDGKPIDAPQPTRLWLYYKPLGLVTSEHDEKGRQTVFESLPDGMPRVMSVGRLDLNSEGLLLLTNDGELTQGLSHPRFEVEKEYEVDVEERPMPDLLKMLENGVRLADGLTAPAKTYPPVIAENGYWRFRIVIHEGRNRQVRRMAESVGLTPRRLKRIRYGFLTLGDLKAGTLRPLTAAEVTRLQELAGK